MIVKREVGRGMRNKKLVVFEYLQQKLKRILNKWQQLAAWNQSDQ